MTLSPPLYGADTPQSFFDAKLEWGWNMRKLQCLLSKRQIPRIPGVNTPMTYFGMWKVCMWVTGSRPDLGSLRAYTLISGF